MVLKDDPRKKTSLTPMLTGLLAGAVLGGWPWQSLVKGLLDSWPAPLGLASLFLGPD